LAFFGNGGCSTSAPALALWESWTIVKDFADLGGEFQHFHPMARGKKFRVVAASSKFYRNAEIDSCDYLRQQGAVPAMGSASRCVKRLQFSQVKRARKLKPLGNRTRTWELPRLRLAASSIARSFCFTVRVRRLSEIPTFVIHADVRDVISGKRNLVIAANFDHVALARRDLIERISIFEFHGNDLISQAGL
jgi:hypothetical protein